VRTQAEGEVFEGIASVTEWLHTNRKAIDLQRQVPHEITYDEMEAGILNSDAAGTISDVLLHLLVLLFENADETFDAWGPDLDFSNTPLDSFSASELLRLCVTPASRCS
jgi:hypothetical protein